MIDLFKKFIFVLFFVLMCSGFVQAQDESTETVELDVESLQSIITEDLISGIEITKDQIKEEVVELENEKSSIKTEKDFLERSLDVKEQSANPDSIKDKLILQEKLETVKKKQDVVDLKEDLIRKKRDVYQKITDLVEQKLKVISDPDLSFFDLNREVNKTDLKLKRFEKEKDEIQRQISSKKREIELLKQDIEAKKILADLREGEEDVFKEASLAREERVNLTQDQIDQLNKKLELVEVEQKITESYVDVIETRRKVSFKDDLLTPVYQKPTNQKIIWFSLSCLFLIALYLFRKKISRKLQFIFVVENGALNFLNQMLITGLISLLIYVVSYFVGYTHFVESFGSRTLLVILLFFLMRFLIQIAVSLLEVIFCALTKKDRLQLRTENPLFSASVFFVWCCFLFAWCLLSLRVFGFESDQIGFLNKVFDYSFLKIGEKDISVLLFIKAGVIIWILYFLSHFLNKFIDKNVYPKTRLDEGAKYTISVFVKYFLVFLGIVAALRVLGFELGALAVLAGTVGIGIGIGLQEIAKNFISGIILLVERPVKVGDYVDVDGLPGRVEAVKARGTVVTTFDNISVVVPNSEFITKQVVNWSYNNKLIRLCLKVGVVYGADEELVRQSLLDVAEAHGKVMKRPEPYVHFVEFGDNALIFHLYVWTNDARNRFNLMSDLHFMVNKSFNERGLVIAFPQRDLHLKTSDVVFQVKQVNENPDHHQSVDEKIAPENQ